MDHLIRSGVTSANECGHASRSRDCSTRCGAVLQPRRAAGHGGRGQTISCVPSATLPPVTLSIPNGNTDRPAECPVAHIWARTECSGYDSTLDARKSALLLLSSEKRLTIRGSYFSTGRTWGMERRFRDASRPQRKPGKRVATTSQRLGNRQRVDRVFPKNIHDPLDS